GAMMAEFADYMFASEETMPGDGFDYRFLKEIGAGGLTGPEVGRLIIDHTFGFYARQAEENPLNAQQVTISAVDLRGIGRAAEAVDALFAAMDGKLDASLYSRVARQRNAAKAFGRTTTTNEYDLVDLADLADSLSALYPAQSQDLLDAVKAMVVYNRANLPRSAGVSLYFPLMNKESFRGGWDALYESFGILPEYRRFMGSFGAILMADSLTQWTGRNAPDVVYDSAAGEYYVQLTAEQAQNFEMAQYYVLVRLAGEEYMLTFISSDVVLDGENRLRANYDGKTLYITDGQGGGAFTPYMQEKENYRGLATYHIPVTLDRTAPDGTYETGQANLLVSIDKNTGEARVTGAIRTDGEDTAMGKRDTNLAEWDNVYMVYSTSFLTRGEDGAPLPFGDWAGGSMPLYTAHAMERGLDAQYLPLSGDLSDYFLMISIVDTQGNVYTSEIMPMAAAAQPAQTPAPGPAKPPVVPYPYAGEPVLLLEREGVTVSLTGIELTENADGRALSLTLGMRNGRAEDAWVTPTGVRAETLMVNGFEGVGIPAGGEAETRLDVPLGDGQGGFGLLREGIERVTDVSVRLRLDYLPSGVLRGAPSETVRFLTDVPLGAPAIPYAGPERKVLAEAAGVTVESDGDVYLEGTALYVPLRITNDSEAFDLVIPEETSVNGIMADFRMDGGILPGSILYTRAGISAVSTVLPPELAAYQYLMDAEDSLEKIGVSQVRDIAMRFRLTTEAAADTAGAAGRGALTAEAVLTMPGTEGFVQPVDDAGEEFGAVPGVRIVRLSSDPAGNRFLVHNQLPFTVRLTTMDRIRADGIPYAGNQPLYAVVSPGKYEYVTLFDSLPGIEPGGWRELSFEVVVINLDENTLHMRTRDTVTLARVEAGAP
ncbi:MAG TPA: clostripain-related cysteine peptidase, partial [Candidatus Limnocylindria bacterium]|nr:clostripain-related cysteine peptidase [Candidatus Limnocylindria bacterium]